MKGVCYLKDPKTGKFVGSKPGCSHGGGEVSEELLQRVEREKGAIKQRVGVAAALGNLKPKASELKDKAERLAREVNNGELSFQEGLYQLSKGNAPFNRYAKAVDLLDRDPKYWRDIFLKGGSDEVDTLLTSFVGVPVTGVADYVMQLADAASSMQTVSDAEPIRMALADAKSGVQQVRDEKLQIPSGISKEELDATHEKWMRIIEERHHPKDSKSIVKRGVYDKNKHTYCHGNVCETQASLYGDYFDGRQTSSGPIHDKHGYTAAMQPTYVGKLDRKKPIYAEVTNKANGKTVIVKVDDTGPFPVRDKDGGTPHKDPTRAIDLSDAAYVKITDNMEKGVLDVSVKFLSEAEGKQRYDEQNKEVAKQRPEIEQKVHDALCKHDPKFKSEAKNKCP
ncbi:MAG: septal ring lytic transglycosylase RlpA family protein [Nitrospirota bacterium]